MSSVVVGVVVSCNGITGKDKLKECEVDVGSGTNITVVTNASNVRLQSRVAVALVGATVSIDGEDVTLKKTTVGGVTSEGMLCDSMMLGWTGGAKGIAVQMPADLALGSAPPASKPRLDDASGSGGTGGKEKEPSAKELKDQKKAEKEARKKELSAKKEARKLLKTKGDTDGTDEGDVKDDAEGEGGTGEVGVEEGVKSLGI